MKEDTIMDAIAIIDIVKGFISVLKITFYDLINIDKIKPPIPKRKKTIWENEFTGCFFISIQISVNFLQDS